MKMKILDTKKSFKPVKIELTIETKEEYDNLRVLLCDFYCAGVELSDFSSEHKELLSSYLVSLSRLFVG